MNITMPGKIKKSGRTGGGRRDCTACYKEIVDEALASYSPDEESEPAKAYLKRSSCVIAHRMRTMHRWPTSSSGAVVVRDVPFATRSAPLASIAV